MVLRSCKAASIPDAALAPALVAPPLETCDDPDVGVDFWGLEIGHSATWTRVCSPCACRSLDR